MKRYCHRHGIVPPDHHCRGHTTTQRGYGWQHQQRRTHLLNDAYYTHCPLCGHPLLPNQQLDLDHSTPLTQNPMSTGDRIVHSTCNRRRGALQRGGGGEPPPTAPDSRSFSREKLL